MTKIIEPSKQSSIFRRPSSETGIWSWITTVDHKRIGIIAKKIIVVPCIVNIALYSAAVKKLLSGCDS